MKQSIIDTDILSEFLRGNEKVVENVDQHLKKFGYIYLSIITYYEILTDSSIKMPKNKRTVLKSLSN